MLSPLFCQSLTGSKPSAIAHGLERDVYQRSGDHTEAHPGTAAQKIFGETALMRGIVIGSAGVGA
jgi:hypothetical protein